MTIVKYELEDGKMVNTLIKAMNSGMNFRKVYIEKEAWDDEERYVYENVEGWYARKRTEMG